MPHRTAYRWLSTHPWITSLIMVALVTIGAAWRDSRRDAEQDRFVQCVATWADDTAARAGKLGIARAELDNKNDDLWRTFSRLLAAPDPNGRAVFQTHLNDYIEASDAYRTAVATNPIPTPPKLNC